jgi:hypothetical protein
MMAGQERWHTADFEAMQWHDVCVHGFRIVADERGTAELVLDIDFILEWIREDDGRFRFRIAQAILQFHEVFGLRFALDYVACSAGMSAFSIDRIERVPLREIADDEDHFGPWRWRIDVGWPEGFLEFESSGFSQWLVGDVLEQPAQGLQPAQRI